jgi:hypothetical protein
MPCIARGTTTSIPCPRDRVEGIETSARPRRSAKVRARASFHGEWWNHLTGLDVLDGDAAVLGPDQQLATDVSGAVVDPDRPGLAAPFDDAFQAPDDPFRRQGKVHLDPQPFAIEVVQHVQLPELATIAEPVSHEVHRPGDVQGIRHRQHVRLVALQPLAGLDSQVQFKGAIDPIDAFVVPWMTLHVAQMQETQAKAPSLAGTGQPDEQIGNLLVLVLQLRAVAIAGLADPARSASS